MSKLPTRLVIAILAIGTLVGAATVMSTGLKPFNQALAQLRVRSYPSGTGSSPIATAAQAQPPIQQPTARAVGTNAPPASAGLPFSFIFPCTGCIITKNLANGAVTTQKIAPGAISISVVERMGAPKDIVPGGSAVAVAVCKPGEVATGGVMIALPVSSSHMKEQSSLSLHLTLVPGF